MSNRDFYKDEFDNYHEVEEDDEAPLDGFEDDEQDYNEDEEDTLDSLEDDDDVIYEDEDEAYLNERRSEYDVDED